VIDEMDDADGQHWYQVRWQAGGKRPSWITDEMAEHCRNLVDEFHEEKRRQREAARDD
jgi:hypothetical protein